MSLTARDRSRIRGCHLSVGFGPHSVVRLVAAVFRILGMFDLSREWGSSALGTRQEASAGGVCPAESAEVSRAEAE